LHHLTHAGLIKISFDAAGLETTLTAGTVFQATRAP
jgi:hypothetical protein